MRRNFQNCCRLLALVLAALVAVAASRPALAQNGQGFIRFSGTLTAVAESGDRVMLTVGVFGHPITVELDEHSTVTGSLGGRTSSRALTAGAEVEVEGWMRTDGSVRAAEVEIKVQTGTIRMSGPIESILSSDGARSILVNGIEFRTDGSTRITVTRDGRSQAGTLDDLAPGTIVDVSGSQLDQAGVGSTTATRFLADRIIALRAFRLQGIIRSRTPASGTPSVIVVQGVTVTLTPDTSIIGNGPNERNEAFLGRDAQSLAVVRGIEDDAGNPCLNTPNEPGINCPDQRPPNAVVAGDLQIGLAVRVEGVVEDTGFSSRYTARAIQVERSSSQIRFQGVVARRTPDVLVVRIAAGIETPIRLEATTRLDGAVEPGRMVEVSVEMDSDLSMRARRIKEIP